MTAIIKSLFLEGRLRTSICLLLIWKFHNTFLLSKILSLKPFVRSLKICYLFWSQLIWQCHDMHSVFQNEKKEISVKNPFCWVRNFWFQRQFALRDRLIYQSKPQKDSYFTYIIFLVFHMGRLTRIFHTWDST